MTEAIVFPDIEAVLVAYLRSLLGVHVSTRVPDVRPASFVRLVRVGGPRRDLITDVPMVVVECWASSDVDASDLARRARAYVFAAEQSDVPGAWIRNVYEVAGPQSYPDPDSGTPRYQFTVQLDVRGEPL